MCTVRLWKICETTTFYLQDGYIITKYLDNMAYNSFFIYYCTCPHVYMMYVRVFICSCELFITN